MSKRYEDKGQSSNLINWIPLPGGTQHVVKDTTTGDYGRVHVNDNQSTGEAIEKGQWDETPAPSKSWW